MAQKFYKVLQKDGRPLIVKKAKPYHLPVGDKPGRWMPKVRGGLEVCFNGYHVCRAKYIGLWVDYGRRNNVAVFEAECRGDGHLSCDGEKFVFRQVRLLRQIPLSPKSIRKLYLMWINRESNYRVEQFLERSKRAHKAYMARKRK